MNENHRLIKDVSNALNFYMERTRREEGFDLSGVLRPGYDLNQFKFNKLFGYSTGYDTTLKKILMPQLSLPKAARPESDEIRLREKFYKDELKYHLKIDRGNRKSQSATNSQHMNRSKSVADIYSKSVEKKRTAKPNVPAGLLTIRSTHTPALTKREKLSMVNITSKIMSASSEICFQKEDIQLMKSLADAKNKSICYVQKSRSQSKRDEREEYERRLLDRHREYERKILLDNLSKEQLDTLMHNKPPVQSNDEEEEAPPAASNESEKSFEAASQPAAASPKHAEHVHKPKDKLNQVDYLK